MTDSRSYNLLCPISRALDHVGDRWTLLILRDLHAGPARFKDLKTGLKGIASNLLSDRLQALEASGLIQKYLSDYDVSLYSLTPMGEETDQLLFELARFGGQMPHPSKIQKPGNLRTMAVSLGTACKKAVGPTHSFVATILIDGETYQLTARNCDAQIRTGAVESPDVVMTTSYEPMMARADGDMEQDEFVSNHVALEVITPGKEIEFFDLLTHAIQEFDRSRSELATVRIAAVVPCAKNVHLGPTLTSTSVSNCSGSDSGRIGKEGSKR